jgi:hypothetical protein
MTQDMEIEPQPVPTKEEIIEDVIEIFIDTILFIEPHEVSKDTNIVKDFKIDTDDLSIFLRSALDYFHIPGEKIVYPNTIEGISDYIFDYLSSGKELKVPQEDQSLSGRFARWVNTTGLGRLFEKWRASWGRDPVGTARARRNQRKGN